LCAGHPFCLQRRTPKWSKKHPDPTDLSVGAKIREQRISLKMSQQALGEAIGLTFQQVQKYEKGTNRVGSSRMMQIRA
jgi:DNA-binding XRE family transcriptional regulator